MPRKENLEPGHRLNQLNIQMISESIHQQIFGSQKINQLQQESLIDVKHHLAEHELLNKPTTLDKNVDFNLPGLTGGDLASHYEHISGSLCKTYIDHAKTLAGCKLPSLRFLYQISAHQNLDNLFVHTFYSGDRI